MNNRAWERAEFVLEKSEETLSIAGTGQQKWKSIHEKLADLYAEENSKESLQAHIRNSSNLLDKLVMRDRLNYLVVNLYPGNEGYTVMLKGRNGTEAETVKLPYEESELLQYIDNEELPPVLVDLLERSPTNLFYSGCVIVELRDYRRSLSISVYECRHVLLKPTTQTLICDINHLTSDASKWSPEDRLTLESHLLLATQEPLCLNPSVSVSLISNYLHNNKYKFGTVPVKKAAKKLSQVALNRKRKLELMPAPPGLQLHDFLMSRKAKVTISIPATLKFGKTVDLWKHEPVDLEPPTSVDVGSLAHQLTAPEEQASEILMGVVEEYTITAEQANGKGYFSRLVILQRWPDQIYFGELYVDRDFIEGLQRGSSCRFELGSKKGVDGYIQQLIEIVTKESQKSIKLTHSVKGQPTKITNIPGGKEVSSAAVQNNASTFLEVVMGTETASLPGIVLKSLQTSTQNPEANSSHNFRVNSISSVAIQHGHFRHIGSPPIDNIPAKLAHTSGGKPSSTMCLASATSTLLPHSPTLLPRARSSGQELNIVSNVQLGPSGFIPEGNAGISQVPLAGITVPQSIPIPISLAMMSHTQTGLMTAHTNVFVSPVQGLVTSAISKQIMTTSSAAVTLPLPISLPGTPGPPRVTQLINPQWKGAPVIGAYGQPSTTSNMVASPTVRAIRTSKTTSTVQQSSKSSPAESPTAGSPPPIGISAMNLVPQQCTQSQIIPQKQVHLQNASSSNPSAPMKGKGRKRSSQTSPK